MIYSKYDDVQDTSLITDAEVKDFTPTPTPLPPKPVPKTGTETNAGSETSTKGKPPVKIGGNKPDGDKPNGGGDKQDDNGDKKFIDKLKDNFKAHKTIYFVVLAIIILIAIYFFGNSQRWW